MEIGNAFFLYLSESGFPGFKDLQDKDFVGCVRLDYLVIMKRFSTSDAPSNIPVA
jgi:hypothetical protein